MAKNEDYVTPDDIRRAAADTLNVPLDAPRDKIKTAAKNLLQSIHPDHEPPKPGTEIPTGRLVDSIVNARNTLLAGGNEQADAAMRANTGVNAGSKDMRETVAKTKASLRTAEAPPPPRVSDPTRENPPPTQRDRGNKTRTNFRSQPFDRENPSSRDVDPNSRPDPAETRRADAARRAAARRAARLDGFFGETPREGSLPRGKKFTLGDFAKLDINDLGSTANYARLLSGLSSTSAKKFIQDVEKLDFARAVTRLNPTYRTQVAEAMGFGASSAFSKNANGVAAQAAAVYAAMAELSHVVNADLGAPRARSRFVHGLSNAQARALLDPSNQLLDVCQQSAQFAKATGQFPKEVTVRTENNSSMTFKRQRVEADLNFGRGL